MSDDLDTIKRRYEEANRTGSDAQFMDVAGEYIEALEARVVQLDDKAHLADANAANLARMLVEVSDARIVNQEMTDEI